MHRMPNVFPESLPEGRGSGWQVEPHTGHDHGAGWTDIQRRRMAVPLDASSAARNIRAHELAHATWTPVRSPAALCKRYGVSHEALQRAEDCRIGFGLVDSQVPGYEDGVLTDADVARLEAEGQQLLAQRGDALRAELAKRLSFQVVSMVMTADRSRIVDLAARVGGEPVRELVEQVAEAAEALLFPKRHDQHLRTLERSRSGLGRKASAAVPFRRAIDVARMLDQLFTSAGAPAAGRRPPKPKAGDPVWGELSIEEPPRRTIARLARMRVVRRASDEGTQLRRLDRLLTDGRIFATKRHLVGGTVLIDASGSMGWSKEEILQCVEAAPAATVAVYSGRGAKGVLRIVAKDGRMIAPALIRPPCGGGNVVDGPALAWLARQGEPRLWISDGCVTGAHEVQHPRLVAEVQHTQLLGRILRLENLPAAVAHFSRLVRTRTTKIS